MYALSIEFGNPGKKYSVSKQAATCHQDMTTSMSPCHGLGRTRQNKDGARQKLISVLVLGRDRRKGHLVTKSRNHAIVNSSVEISVRKNYIIKVWRKSMFRNPVVINEELSYVIAGRS